MLLLRRFGVSGSFKCFFSFEINSLTFITALRLYFKKLPGKIPGVFLKFDSVKQETGRLSFQQVTMPRK